MSSNPNKDNNEKKYRYATSDVHEISDRLNKRRLDNLNEHYRRKDMIHEKFPRIKEIDDEISAYSLKVAKARILNPSDSSLPTKEDVRKHNLELSQIKRELLKENGYPEDYLDEIISCPLCQDTGIFNNKQCSCFKQMIIDDLYNSFNLRFILDVENFENFNYNYYSDVVPEGQKYSPRENITSIVKRSHEYIDNFMSNNGDSKQNIIINGTTGVGKTFLLNCITKEIIGKGHTVLYISSNELFNDIISTAIKSKDANDKSRNIYNALFTADLLVIDDLGTEINSSFVQSYFYEIVNKRMTNGKSTLISTNLSLSQLQERYEERIMSRLVETSYFFYIYTDDIRFQKRKEILNKSRKYDTN